MSEINSPNMADDYSQFVPFTARMMAALRSRESQHPDPLFDDPYAAGLAGEEAFQQIDRRLAPQDQTYVAVRTRFFDDFLANAPAQQVVILAAGLDTRAYRCAWPSGSTIYELDQPEVLAYKAERLQGQQPAVQHHLIPADLTQDWIDTLLAAGYAPALPSVWLIEGLLMYLSQPQVHQLLASVSQLSTPGSQLGLDLINLKGLDYAPYRGYFQFGCDLPEQLLSQYGWQAEVVQPGDEQANFGRYREPISDPTVPDAMRVFLVKAVKGHG